MADASTRREKRLHATAPLTTLAMVRLGKVTGNLMTDLQPSNEKLRRRAIRMVQTLTGAGAPAARAALEKAKWRVKAACRRLK